MKRVIRIYLFLVFLFTLTSVNAIENLELNSTVSGAWTSNSTIPSDIKRYTEYYAFNLKGVSEVTIHVDSEINGIIKLFGDPCCLDGVTINEFDYTDILPFGKYRIGISTNSDNEIGAFKLFIGSTLYDGGFLPPSEPRITLIKVKPFSATISIENIEQIPEMEIEGYKIYLDDRRVDTIIVAGNPMVEYAIEGLSPNTSYKYGIQAYNPAGETCIIEGEFSTKEDNYAWLIPIYDLQY